MVKKGGKGGEKDEVKQQPTSGGRWSKAEDKILREAVTAVGARNWKRISFEFFSGSRSDVQCLHRWQKVLRPGLVKGPWTQEEDQMVIKCINMGITKWSEIASRIPGRIGKQCRERWFNHLDPTILKTNWSEREDAILVEAQLKFGNKWSQIAKLLPGRAENAVKNRWNSSMRKKLMANRKKTQGDTGKSKTSGRTKSASSAKKSKARVKSGRSGESKSKRQLSPSSKRSSHKKKRRKGVDIKDAVEAATTMAIFATKAVISPPPSPPPMPVSNEGLNRTANPKVFLRPPMLVIPSDDETLNYTDKNLDENEHKFDDNDNNNNDDEMKNKNTIMTPPEKVPPPGLRLNYITPKSSLLNLNNTINSTDPKLSRKESFEVISPVHHKLAFNNGVCSAVTLKDPVLHKFKFNSSEPGNTIGEEKPKGGRNDAIRNIQKIQRARAAAWMMDFFHGFGSPSPKISGFA